MEEFMEEKERVLLAVATKAIAARTVERIARAGGEVTVVGSVAEARGLEGDFDRGVFTFDLPDGSGIVLAAELMLEARLGRVEFFHPNEERAARDGRSGVRSTAGAIPEPVANVA
jgi:hypothetical protein